MVWIRGWERCGKEESDKCNPVRAVRFRTGNRRQHRAADTDVKDQKESRTVECQEC